MAERLAQAEWGKPLVYNVTCPNCWHVFPPEDACYIAKHPDLINDPIAGADEKIRFLPRRFNIKGEALDARGMATTDIACPNCHLQISEALMEVEPFFISVVGAPASGKSYMLATMSWELRRLMPRAHLSFSDADPVANRAIHEYEETLFLSSSPDRLTEIRKTAPLDSRLHKMVTIEGQQVRFPRPLEFTLWPTPDHPRYAEAHKLGRIVILYDNAGEDFNPAHEEMGSAVVQHLSKCKIIFMLFDPIQDPRLRKNLRSADPQLSHGLRPGMDVPLQLRQETLLREVAVRMRRYLGLPQDKRITKPLIVVVSKFDVCEGLVDVSIDTEPFAIKEDGFSLDLDLERIEKTSDKIRGLFQNCCPEFVATADGLSENVRYIPVSSFACSPVLVGDTADKPYYGIRPKDVHPRWVTVPLLYSLCKWSPGVVACDTECARS